MSDIKMSDTFDLPVGSTEFTLVAMSKSTYISMDVAAVIAINSYDANQERIAELEEIVKAVAHIGVDFGYGKYELEVGKIDDARTLMEQE